MQLYIKTVQLYLIKELTFKQFVSRAYMLAEPLKNRAYLLTKSLKTWAYLLVLVLGDAF